MEEQNKTREFIKKAIKSTGSTLILVLGVSIAVKVATDLYDVRMVLAVLAGKFGYDAVYNALGKVRGLE